MNQRILNILRVILLIVSFSYGITMISGVNFTNLLGTSLTLIIWSIIESILIDAIVRE